VGDQIGPPQQERAQKDFAELGVGLHDAAQVFEWDFHDFSGAHGTRSYQAAASAEHVQFSSELAGTLQRDNSFPFLRRTQDLYLSGDQDVESAFGLTALENHIAGSEAAALAEMLQASDLLRPQLGEHRFV